MTAGRHHNEVKRGFPKNGCCDCLKKAILICSCSLGKLLRQRQYWYYITVSWKWQKSHQKGSKFITQQHFDLSIIDLVCEIGPYWEISKMRQDKLSCHLNWPWNHFLFHEKLRGLKSWEIFCSKTFSGAFNFYQNHLSITAKSKENNWNRMWAHVSVTANHWAVDIKLAVLKATLLTWSDQVAIASMSSWSAWPPNCFLQLYFILSTFGSHQQTSGRILVGYLAIHIGRIGRVQMIFCFLTQIWLTFPIFSKWLR